MTPADDGAAASSTQAAFARIQRLETEAKTAAQAETARVLADLGEIGARCGLVATLQSVKPGVRSELEQLSRKLEEALQTIASIQLRAD